MKDLDTLREVVAEIQRAEKIDAEHGLRLPGDSALYITFWGWESMLGEIDRGDANVPFGES